MFTLFFFYDAPRNWQMSFQDPATITMNSLIDLHHDIMFFLILITGFVSYFFYIIIRDFTIYKIDNKLPSDVTHNVFIEVIWTTIPSIILFIIAIPSFSLLYLMEELKDPEVTLKVIGHQWYWSYEYHDPKLEEVLPVIEHESRMVYEEDLEFGAFRLLEAEPALVLPTNTNIRILITSDDVIHSWAVPSFGIKMDAVPGRLNQVFLNISRPGVFYGQCSEICGVNHGFMPITIVATDFRDDL
jgi:heme/copper-type cytochrome/quinol oxidase subunit 2